MREDKLAHSELPAGDGQFSRQQTTLKLMSFGESLSLRMQQDRVKANN